MRAALDGVTRGRLEVLADDISVGFKASLAKYPGELYPQTVHY